MPRTLADSSRVVTPIPFDRFRDEELESYRSKSSGRYRGMRRAFQIAENLGVESTGDLTPDLLDRYVQEMERTEINDAAITRCLGTFRTLCKLAVHRGALDCSPFDVRPALRLRISRVN